MVEHSAFDRLTGTTLGNYLLEQVIEQGEAGSVFIARNNTAGAKFRLRILVVPPNLTPEDRLVYLGRFQREANQVASLHHTYILPLIDYGAHNAVDVQGQGRQEKGRGDDSSRSSWPYLVSPYLPMKSLSAQLAQKGPMDAALASRYLDQIAAALESAHRQAVLHRNLTTDCIFIKQDGTLLVADFGVMRILEIGTQFSATDGRRGIYGMNAASAPAPEQILGHAVDTYTDVYALGAVLYRMLSGHRVFRGKTLEEIFQQHLQAPIPSLATWRSDLPKALDGVIARAMAKEPTQRFRQPGELANAYHEVVAPNDIKRVAFIMAPTPTISRQSQAKQPQEILSSRSQPVSRRRALTFIAAGGGAAAAIVAVAVFGRNYLAGNTSPANTSTSSSLANTPPANTPVANVTKTTPTRQGGPVLARTSDIPLNNAKTFPISGHSNPGLLIHLPDGRFVAFDSTCTHAGCAVKYSSQDKLLECPCHGAAFDPAKNAAVVQGPAITPLAPINITVNANGTITQG